VVHVERNCSEAPPTEAVHGNGTDATFRTANASLERTLGRKQKGETRMLYHWLADAPAGTIGAIATGIGAIVAFVAAVLTQWILSRRARTELLTAKLEELYLALLGWSSDVHAARFAIEALLRSQALTNEQRAVIFRDYYKPDTARRLNMYISLYFPRLEHFRDDLWNLNRNISSVIRRFGESKQYPKSLQGEGPRTTEVSLVDLHREYLTLPMALKPLFKEMSKNRVHLTHARIFPPAYVVSDHFPVPKRDDPAQ
jgi:hypothetical protein